jgi:hypothetical protein
VIEISLFRLDPTDERLWRGDSPVSALWQMTCLGARFAS